MQDSIFSILYQNNDGVKHVGVGFFVGRNGLFITAGHIFRLKENPPNNIELDNFRAFLRTSRGEYIVEFKDLWYESYPIGYQNSPTYIDVCVGRIDFNNSIYLLLDRKSPHIGKNLTAYMYYNPHYEKNIGSNFNSSLLLRNIEFLSEELQLLKNTAESIVNGENRIFNNCSVFRGIAKPTYSGSPIMDENNLVKGILVGGSRSERTIVMIRSKYCSKMIQFKTYYSFSPFEYIEAKYKQKLIEYS